MWASTQGSADWSTARRATDKLCLSVLPKVNALCVRIDRPCRRGRVVPRGVPWPGLDNREAHRKRRRGHARPLHKTCPP